MRNNLSKIASILTILLIGGIGVQTIISCSLLEKNDGDNPSSDSDGGISSSSNNGSSNQSSSEGGNANNSSCIQGTVTIGNQVWQKCNLNVEPTGTDVATKSSCPSGSTLYCAKLGRLYDWATAMALPSSCNSNSCSDLIQPKHRGICPENFHLPSDAEWNELLEAVGGAGTAGRYLKSTTGWTFNGNGEDKYGFSALLVSCSDNLVGGSCWWSASEPEPKEYNSYAYQLQMRGESEYAGLSIKYKTALISVRCLQD